MISNLSRKILNLGFVFVSLFFWMSVQEAHASTYMRREIACLERMIYYEARGESLNGMKAVAYVTMNRVRSDKFPNSVCKVISQRGQYQWYHNARLRRSHFYPGKDKRVHAVAVSIYMRHASRNYHDPLTDRALFFSSGKHPNKRAKLTVIIGSHRFYR